MNNKPTKGRVLVVEENPRMLTFLRFLLNSEGYDLIGVPDSRLARGVLESPPGPVGLIILDVVDGFALLQRIRLEGNDVPIIFVSSVSAAKVKARVLWVGADDYVVNPFDPVELLARVAALLRRAGNAPSMPRPQPPLRVGGVELDAVRRKVRTSTGREAELTAAEMKLLHCLMTNAGKPVTREELMSSVWGDGCRRSYYSLAAHVSRLRGKVEEHPSDPSYIRNVRGAGYVFLTP